MGFITEELAKENDKYILFKDVVLYFQSLDEDNPSLSDAATILLRLYNKTQDIDISIDYLDMYAFKKDMTSEFYRYEKIHNPLKEYDENRPFRYFLEFVIEFDSFSCGTYEDNPTFPIYNHFTDIYLLSERVEDFFKNSCKLKNLPDLIQTVKSIHAKQAKEAEQIYSANSFLTDFLFADTEETKLQELEEQIKALEMENINLKEKLKNIPKPQAQIIQVKSISENNASNSEYTLIQQHRKHAPEFEALIQTLIHHAAQYNYETGEQPFKTTVADTFRKKPI